MAQSTRSRCGCQEKRLAHREEAEKFYSSPAGQEVRVGMEASGHARWFERLLADLQFELRIEDAAEISPSQVAGMNLHWRTTSNACFSSLAFGRDEKPGLRRDALRSQLIHALEAQEIKETGNQEGKNCCGKGDEEFLVSQTDDRAGSGGSRSSWYCSLDEAGEVLLEQRLGTTPNAVKEVFGVMPRGRIALETGMHSAWMSRLLSELGHEVIVAHARRAFDRGKPEERRSSGCANAGAVGEDRSPVAGAGETSQRKSASPSDCDPRARAGLVFHGRR
jgi:hypothetical protein